MRSLSRSTVIATSIVRKLFDAGYIAYFAGGWVRDYLLGSASDEIDIATNAPPEAIIQLFPKTIPVGIKFGVLIVVVEGKNFEVSTFRKDHPYHDGRHPEGIDFSSPEKDALRRDFTINGMFFDPLTQTLYDYVEGQADLHQKIVRAIGDPEIRFAEDKLRLMRAIRFASKLGFTIEEKTLDALYKLSNSLLPSVSIERVWQELVKMSQAPRFQEALLAMHQCGLLSTIFPNLSYLSLEMMQKLLYFIPYFPINCPTIIYLLELFPDNSLDEWLKLCHYLKLSKEHFKIVTFFYQSKRLFSSSSISRTSLAYFYAHAKSSLFLEIMSHKTPDKEAFFAFHETKKETLRPYIEKIQKKEPLITASLLQQEGILPGIKMGLLLKEAERIAIDEDIQDPFKVIQKLKQTSLW